MTLEPGTIVYFTPFYFPDGGSAAKNKYFIFLCADGPDMLVAALPTRTDRTPPAADKQHGCIQAHDAEFSCYHFEEGRAVTTDGWSFPEPTYIYPRWVETYQRSIFEDIYTVENVDYETVGRLTQAEYDAALKCITTSHDAKMKYKKLLAVSNYAA